MDIHKSNAKPDLRLSPTARQLFQQEHEYTVGGFEPVPAFFTSAKGSTLWDADGKEYIDFVAMFSCVNQGHCHPYIVDKIIQQLQKVTIVNLAAHNATFGPFAERICKRFAYAKLLAMTSGTEAAETACKIARKWGIVKKKIQPDECIVLGVGESYHGLSQGVWGLQDPSVKRKEYGLDSSIYMNVNPTTREALTYLDLAPMRRCIQEHRNRIAAVIMECLHGTARSTEEEKAYARGVYDLCKEYNILFIADEIRQGSGKTGKFFSFNHLGEDCKPDLVMMGKSITGGVYPQSFVMGVEEAMSLVGKYEVGGTYAFSPLGIAAANAAIDVIDNEHLVEKAASLGELWTNTVNSWSHPRVDYVACIGADSNLFLRGVSGYRVAALCMHRGLLLYPRPNKLRISFAMTMSHDTLLKGAEIIRAALDDVDSYGYIEGEDVGAVAN